MHTNVLADKDTVQRLHVPEGSEAFFTGLFTSDFGQKRNVPIVRFGRIALMPAERVPIGTKADGSEDLRELYLLEARPSRATAVLRSSFWPAASSCWAVS